MIAEDPRSADIIKPILRGRDIKRYRAEWAGLWLIATFPALALNIDNYPAVKRHLLSFGKARLEQSSRILPNGTKSRKKTVHAWYELQDTCAYHEVFGKEKLFWMHMAPYGRFAYSGSEIIFCNQKAFIVTGNFLKYLCAILNSRLITWQVENIAVTTGMGLIQWDKFVVERLPIPKMSTENQQIFTRLVDEILKAKASGSIAIADEQGAEIDRLVYALYGLTEKEIAAIAPEEKA